MTSRTQTVSLHTLGCKLNQTETATIGRQFVRSGFEVVPFGQQADVVVLNTCSVTEKADRECRQLVRRIRRSSPDAFVAVVGCYAQLRPWEIATLPGVDLVAGTAEKFDVVQYALRGRTADGPRVLHSTPTSQGDAVVAHSQGLDRTRAFLKVQDGCDYTCSFCTIPLARGSSRSVPADVVVDQAHVLAANGYREIVLTGVNTGDYGRKEGSALVRLVERLVGVEGIDRIRISSVEPNLLTDELLELWMGHEKLCKHWHIPLQSGSDTLLRAMRRRYTTEWYRDRIERIHHRHPYAGIGCDVIVGFPGESERLFEETTAFIKDLPLSYLHVFSYSRRPSTLAMEMPDQVAADVRAARSETLRRLGDRKQRTFNESFVGKTVSVLVEGRDDTGRMTGLSGEYVRVRIEGDSAVPNELVPIMVHSVDREGCIGTPVSSSSTTREVQHAVA